MGIAKRAVGARESDVDHSDLRLLKPGLRGLRKPEVEGSRPSVHGTLSGSTTISPDWAPKTKNRSHEKTRFQGSVGVGKNRDKQAAEALRYYQDQEKRRGKQCPEKPRKNIVQKS